MGNTAQDIYYYPYGEIKTNTGSDIAKHKFTGQEYDAETGLYYYGARYYDPKLARFISADTIVPDPINPQALNRYSYVLNNPLKYIDPTGHGWWEDLWDDITDFFESTVGAVIEIVVGAVLTAVGCPAGPIMMAHGFVTLGANVNVSMTTQVGSFGDDGGGGPGDVRFEYTGPGNGSGPGNIINSGGGGSGGLQYATDNGITLYMTFYNRYSNYQYNSETVSNSINRDMYPSQTRTKEKSESALMRMAKGTAFGFMAAGVVSVEVFSRVGRHVGEIIIQNRLLKYARRFIKPLRKESNALVVDIAIGKTITARGAIQDYTSGYRKTGERVGRRIKKLREWWFEQ